MRTKRVVRYYCEFCKKSGGLKSAMVLHEKHCTMNPNRQCRMCEKIDGIQKPMVELIALAKDLSKLRDAASDCPMCILAALRQAGLVAEAQYDYAGECKKIFADMAAKYEVESYVY